MFVPCALDQHILFGGFITILKVETSGFQPDSF